MHVLVTTEHEGTAAAVDNGDGSSTDIREICGFSLIELIVSLTIFSLLDGGNGEVT